MPGLVDKLKGLVKEREGQIRSAVDKAGEFVDDKTKGKYHDKIAKAGEKADQVITKATADGAAGEGQDASTGGASSATDTASQATSEAKDTAAEADKGQATDAADAAKNEDTGTGQ